MSEADALLQQVADERDRRCASLRAAAESQAKEIVRSARAQARANVHTAVTQERTRMDLGLRRAAARADIEVRRQERQKSRELLIHLWATIAGVLENRWQEPTSQTAWIEAVLGQAGVLLSGRSWVVEVGSDWPEPKRSELTDRAHKRGARAVEYAVHTSISAGLKIRAGTVCVDATVAGVLVERDTIESAFLAEYTPVLATEERTHA